MPLGDKDFYMNPCCAMIIDTPRRKGTLMRTPLLILTVLGLHSERQPALQATVQGGRNINIFTMPLYGFHYAISEIRSVAVTCNRKTILRRLFSYLMNPPCPDIKREYILSPFSCSQSHTSPTLLSTFYSPEQISTALF